MNSKQFLAKVVLMSDLYFIIGDTNVHLERKEGPHTIQFEQVLSSFDLRQYITAPIHSQGGILDVVIAGDDCPCITPTVSFIPFSDHPLVSWTVNITKPAIVLQTIKGRRWKEFDLDNFRMDLESSFPDVTSAPINAKMIGDVDMLVHHYNVTIAALLDKYAPSVDIPFRSRRSNKWFDEACQRA